MSYAGNTPPVAPVVPANLEKHGHVRTDNYYWLNERDNPEVVAYLEAENVYTQALMAHTQGLKQTLFEEIKDRIKQTDRSVPYRKENYYYYTRFEAGKDYPFYCRKKESLAAPEEVMLDVNVMAPAVIAELFKNSRRDSFSFCTMFVSPNLGPVRTYRPS